MSTFDQKNQKVDTQLNADKINVELKPITCPECKHGNPAQAKFCSECGTSLLFKCPICKEETPVGAKFCLGCGIEISKADEKIKLAEKMRGGSTRELSFTYRGFVYNKLNPLSYLAADRRTLRFALDIDEYVIKEENSVLLCKGDSSNPSWEGYLYLTNKRIILLGFEPTDRIDSNVCIYPIKDISEINYNYQKGLLGASRNLNFMWEGKLRKLTGFSDNFNEEWEIIIKGYLKEK